MAQEEKSCKNGLVLSGGAVRGIAHLGVLKALEELNYSIDIISGCSAGSLAGAFYCNGLDPEEILDIFTSKKIFDLMFLSLPKSGLMRTTGLKKMLKKHLKSTKLEDLEKPLIIAATNYKTANIEYFEEGPLIDILMASAGIPVLFEVIHIDGVPYIDGGVRDNLPVNPLKPKCEKLIGVHVNPISTQEEVEGPMRVAERAFHMAIASEIERKKDVFDIFIEPQALIGYGMFDLKKAKEIYKIGYDEAKKILKEQK